MFALNSPTVYIPFHPENDRLSVVQIRIFLIMRSISTFVITVGLLKRLCFKSYSMLEAGSWRLLREFVVSFRSVRSVPLLNLLGRWFQVDIGDFLMVWSISMFPIQVILLKGFCIKWIFIIEAGLISQNESLVSERPWFQGNPQVSCSPNLRPHIMVFTAATCSSGFPLLSHLTMGRKALRTISQFFPSSCASPWTFSLSPASKTLFIFENPELCIRIFLHETEPERLSDFGSSGSTFQSPEYFVRRPSGISSCDAMNSDGFCAKVQGLKGTREVTTGFNELRSSDSNFRLEVLWYGNFPGTKPEYVAEIPVNPYDQPKRGLLKQEKRLRICHESGT